jgi:heme/copper-type cytochrome/quinol oxidase subunit 1
VPTLTRWFIKSAMLYLLSALVLSVAMQSPLDAEVPLLRVLWPTYLHLLVVGWLTQLILGVAFWLFPKYSSAKPRGSERLGWTSFVLINLGLLLRLWGEPLALLGGSAAGVLVASAIAQLLAGWAFVANTWPRVRER